jgi:hypothetical protein
MSEMRFEVPDGTVLFSTMMAPSLAYAAMSLTAPSKADRSLAEPAPRPDALVGVFTARKMTSALSMAARESVLKKRLLLRARPSTECTPPSRAIRTTGSSPGS